MSATTPEADLTLEVDLDAPRDRVWRAISIAEYRRHWLPEGDLVSEEAVVTTPGRTLSYRLREDAPPYDESLVTFHLEDGADGGTRLSIRQVRASAPANDNRACLRLAA